MNTERLETKVGWETSDVDRGLQRVERAFERMNSAEEKSAKASVAREAQAAQRQRQAREKAVADLDKIDKEAQDKRVAHTESTYKRLQKIETDHQARIAQGMKQNQIRAGISGNDASPSHAAGGGSAGGHGGNGHGLISGRTAQMAGDILDQVSGAPGWVYRLRGLNAVAPALMRMAGGAAGLGALGGGALVAGDIARNFIKGRGEMDANQKASDRLGEELVPMSRAASLSTVGSGASVLGDEREAVLEQARKEQANQAKLTEFSERAKGHFEGGGNLLARMTRSAGYGLADVTKSFFTGQTNAELLEQSNQRNAVLGSDAKRLGGERTAALGLEKETAAQRLSGSEFSARRIESDLGEKREVSEARKRNASDSDIKLIAEKFGLQREGISREAKLERSGISESRRLTNLQRDGRDLEVGSAQIKLGEAKTRLAAGGNVEQIAAAKQAVNAAQLELDHAKLTVAEREKIQAIELGVATNRGNAEQRETAAAAAAIAAAETKRDYAKTEVEWNQANLEVEKAKTAQILQQRNLARQGMQFNTAIDNTREGMLANSAGLRLPGNEDAARAANLTASRDAAVRELNDAQKDPERDSIEGKKRIAAAAGGVGSTQMNLKQNEAETSRARRIELDGAQTETAAIRLDNSGRSDLAGVARTRQSGQIAIEDALRQGKPAVAEELRQQQGLREQGMVDDKYLNPDGTRRRRVHGAEADQRRAQHRREGFNTRLERNGGLVDLHRDANGNIIDGRDPLTGKRETPWERFARTHRADDQVKKDEAAGGKTFTDIWTVLNERLPQKVN